MNAPLPSGHFSDPSGEGPRFRAAGDLTLDLFHRDGRVDDLWLGLLPDEFAILWKLAAQPGERLTVLELLGELWSTVTELPGDLLAVPFSALRRKLAAAGVAYLICTDGEGRFFIEVPAPSGLSSAAAS